jgi:hypothetical protein
MDKAFEVVSYWNSARAASLIVAEEIYEDQPDGRKNARKRRRRIAHSESLWAKTLEDREKLEEPSSREAELFRLRFRVPYPVFLSLVEWTKSWREKSPQNPDGVGTCDVTGNPRIPTDVMVLGVLRILGRGSCLDGIYELSGIHPSTMGPFLHQWTRKYRQLLYPLHVKMPDSKTEISEVLGAFAAVGFPGCMGSIDVVHVRWDKCPSHKTNLFTGKEGYPVCRI